MLLDDGGVLELQGVRHGDMLLAFRLHRLDDLHLCHAPLPDDLDAVAVVRGAQQGAVLAKERRDRRERSDVPSRRPALVY